MNWNKIIFASILSFILSLPAYSLGEQLFSKQQAKARAQKSADIKQPIIINALLKSGSTYLQQNLIHGLRYKSETLPFLTAKEWYVELPTDITKPAILTKQHFVPTTSNIGLFKILADRIVIHVRDPRQVLISWVHHLKVARVMQDEIVFFDDINMTPEQFHALAFEQQVDLSIEHFLPRTVRWIKSWLAVKTAEEKKPYGLKILLTTYDELIKNEQKLYNKIMAFYQIPTSQFKRKEFQKNDVVRFRKGDTQEWRTSLTAKQKQRVAELVPNSLLQQFNWQA